MSTVITAGNATNGLSLSADNTGTFDFKTGTGAGTTAVYIDASQNVGVGTSTPSAKFQVNDATKNCQMFIGYSDNNNYYQSNGQQNWTNYNGSSTWMVLDSSGNLKFNSGYGSAATAYGCRAWVNFNGTGTVAIRASGNVTSITDNGTGDYTVNFTTAMPDANYSATHGQGPRSVAPFCSVYVSNTSSTYSFQTINTITGAAADASIAFVAVFR